MQLPKSLDRPLYYINSLAIFWFLAFIVIGPKYTIGSSVLLLLGLVALPFNLLTARVALKEQAPWIIALSVYTLYIVAFRALEGLPPEKLDPPFRFLAAIPILIYLRRYGFHPAAIGLGAAMGCLLGGAAGLEEILSGKATRAGSTIAHHPIPYGTLMAMLAMCALHSAVDSRMMVLRIIFVAGTAAGLMAVVLSGTRGLVPAILIAVTYMGFQSLEPLRVNKPKALALVLLASATLALTAYQAPIVKTRITETKAEIAAIQSGHLGSSFGLRLQMWHAAIHLASQSPLFGVGTGQEKRGAAAADFLEQRGYNPDLFKWFDHLHSEYLDTLASYGLFGLATLLALLAGAVRHVPRPGRLPLMMALVVIAIEALTEAVFVDTKLAMGFVFLVTVLRSQAYTQPSTVTETHLTRTPLPRP